MKQMPLRRAGWALGVLLTGCAENPYIERDQLILIDEIAELQLGAQAFQELLGRVDISDHPLDLSQVERIGWRLVSTVHQPTFAWEFTVIVDDQFRNSFCLPGGKVGVTTGLLKILKDEASLAFVLAHEIAHALARHGIERLSLLKLVESAGLALLSPLGLRNLEKLNLVFASLGAILDFNSIIPYDRGHELEADALAIKLMAKAGYDPRKAVETLMIVQRTGSGAPRETHPAPETRLRDLEAALPEAETIYAGVPHAAVAPLTLASMESRRPPAAVTVIPQGRSHSFLRLMDGKESIKALAFEFQFDRDVYVDKVRVLGPGGARFHVGAEAGIASGVRKSIRVHRGTPHAPDFPEGPYTLTFEGRASGRPFVASCAYTVK